MMTKTTFIRDLHSDIQKIENLLLKYINNLNTTSFRRLLSDLKNQSEVKYSAMPLELKFNDNEIPRHLSHSNVINLRLYFSIKLEVNYENFCAENDPLSELEFNIFAYATNKNNRSSELIYSLHLDRHITSSGDGVPNEVHPMYHFQFGGRKLKEKNIDYGQALFFDSPRIAHHPMDFILGLDFVLSNFLPNIWNLLQKEGVYVNLIRKYQGYFMKPYYQSIGNYFDRSLSSSWNAKSIYPQLIG